MFSRFFKRQQPEEEAQVAADAAPLDAPAAEQAEEPSAAEPTAEAAGEPEAPAVAEAPAAVEAPAEAAEAPAEVEAPAEAAEVPAEAESPAGAVAEAPDEASFDPFATQQLEAIQQSLEAEAQAFTEQETALLPAAGAAAAVAAATPAAATTTDSAQTGAPLPIEEQPPSEIDLGPERRGGLWVWIGLIFGMLLAAGAIGYAWWYTTSRPIPVPAVIGKVSPQAVQQINDVGLRLGRIQEEATDTAEVGEVIDQEPAAATNLKPGDLVSLVIAASPVTTEVPEVTGRMRDDAFAELAAKSLSAKVVESFDTSAPAGTVIVQIPAAGVNLKPGALIALAISKGPAPTQVRMPRLIGLKQTDANTLLSANHLRGTVFHSYNASITVGEIYAQAPLADTSVAYDSWTQYLVSDGAGTRSVTVPSVIGTTKKVAESRLKDRGLKVITKNSPHLSVPKGQVISQIPPANAKVARSATVGIIVSRGSTNTTMVPDFSGKSSMDASLTAGTAGFTAQVIEVPISGHTQGMVFGQWPAPGTQWTRRFPVMIVTARLP